MSKKRLREEDRPGTSTSVEEPASKRSRPSTLVFSGPHPSPSERIMPARNALYADASGLGSCWASDFASSTASCRAKATMRLLRSLPVRMLRGSANEVYDALTIDVLQAVEGEEEVPILMYLLMALATLAQSPRVNAEPVVSVLCDMALHRPVVASRALACLRSTVMTKPSPSATHTAALAALRPRGDLNLELRRCAVPLLSSSRLDVARTFAVVLQCTQDTSLRKHALQMLLAIHSRGGLTNIVKDLLRTNVHVLYARALQSLDDDEAPVRSDGLKLMWLLARLFPAVGLEVPAYKTLLDDAFVRVCAAVGDIVVEIRVLALRVLGSLEASASLLLNTLDKKLILEKKKNTKSEGNPGSDVSLDEAVRMADAGAAGALVHGLEDENLAVRSASIDSMCEMSARSPAFAARAIEPLVDMFNDEIEAVRLNATNSLRKISRLTFLAEEQLHVVLASLDDRSQRARSMVHDLLASTTLSNATCVHAAVQALVGSVAKYPRDWQGVFTCCSAIGKRHPFFVEFLILPLLRLDASFIPSDQHPDNPCYVAVLAVFASATLANPRLHAALPLAARKHTVYLCDKHGSAGGMFPSSAEYLRRVEMLSEVVPVNEPSTDVTAGISRVLREIAAALAFAASSSARAQTVQTVEGALRAATRDLTALARQVEDGGTAAAGDARPALLCCAARALEVVFQAKRNMPGPGDRLARLTHKMLHTFLGLPIRVRTWMEELALFASIVEVADGLDSSDEAFAAIRISLRRSPGGTLASMCIPLISVATTRARQLVAKRIIADFVPGSIPPCDHLVKQCSGTILYPAGGTDRVMQVSAALALELPLEGVAHHISDPASICIKVRHPDGDTTICDVESKHMTLRGTIVNFCTTIRLQPPRWAGVRTLYLSVVMRRTDRVIVLSPETHVRVCVVSPTKTY